MPVASDLLVRVGFKDDGASAGLDRVGGKVDSFASGVGKVGAVAATAFAGIGIAAVAGIGSAVSAAMDFQGAMADVQALLGVSADQMAVLSDAAIALGQDTTLAGVGATDAAAAMQQLAAAGFNVQDIAGGAARGVLLLASATGTAVPQAAEIAGDAFNAFRTSMNLTAADMPKIADLFVGAANASSIGLQDIGESMKYIGPIAASMGISIEDVTAAIAELGNQGIKGSQAGTALRSMLVSIAKPSEHAADLIKDLGLQFFDAQGHVKDFAGISDELKSKLAGLSDQQRASALATLFGTEALSAATVLYGEGGEGIRKYITAINEQGDAAKNGAIRNDTLRGSLAALGSSWETLTITLGTAFIPAIRAVVDWAGRAVSAAIPLIQAWGPQLVAGLQAGIAALVGFGRAFGSAIGAVVGALQSLLAGNTTLAQFIGGMEIFVTTIRNQLAGLALAAAPYLAQFFAAIGTAIATYAPQIAAQFQLWALSFVDWIQTTAIPFLQPRLAAFLAAIGTWITGTALPAIGAAATTLAAALSDWITTTAIPFLQTNLPIWLAALGDWLTGTAVPAAQAFLVPLAERFGAWVADAVPPLLAQLGKWYVALEGWLYGTALPAAVKALYDLALAFGDWVRLTAVPYLLANLPGWLAALGSWLTGTALPAAVGFLYTVALAFGDWVLQKAVPYLREKIPLWLTAIKDFITVTAIPAVKAGLIFLGSEFGDFITSKAVPWLESQIPLWLDAITGFITKTAIPEVQTQAKALGTALVDFFMAEAEKLKGKAQAEMGKLPAAILAGVGDLSKLLVSAGAALIQGLINGINSRAGEVASAAAALAKAAADAIAGALGIKSPSKVTAEMGREVVAGLVQGMDSAAQDAAKKAAEVASAVAKGISDSLGAFASLDNFTAPPVAAIYAVGKAIRLAVNDFAVIAEQVTAEAAEAAGKFAEGAGNVVSTIGTGVAAFIALKDFAAPADAAIYAFGKTVRKVVNDLALVAEQVTVDAANQAGKFADGVGKILAIIGPGVAGFAALDDFTAPLGATIDGFIASLGDFMKRFGAATQRFAGQSFDQATAFAEAAGKVLAIIGPGVTGLKDLATFVAPAQSAMDAFALTVRNMLAIMAKLATTVATDGQEAAATFAEAMGKVFAGLSSATGFFKSLDNLLLPDEAGIARILAPMLATVRAVAAASRTLDAATLAGAGALADTFGKVFTGIEAGNRALAGAAVAGGGGGGGGTTYIYQFTVSGPIYGFDQFEDEVVGALEDARRRGRIL